MPLQQNNKGFSNITPTLHLVASVITKTLACMNMYAVTLYTYVY